MKRCIACEEEKPLTEFYFTGDYPQSRCKPCFNEKARENYKKDPEYQRMRRRRYLYGISQEQYDAMLEAQHGRCAICRIKYDKEYHVDHSKETGEVRGLLCNNCNTGLGKFKDDSSLLLEAARYLEKYDE